MPLTPNFTEDEHRIHITETDAKGAVRVGLIRCLVVSTIAAAAAMGGVWALYVGPLG